MDDKDKLPTTTEPPPIEKGALPMDKSEKIEWLKVMYGETNSNYRNLADIRFKLLGFLPAISVITWTELYKNVSGSNVTQAIIGAMVGLLGLLITYGVWIYDNRNTELYVNFIDAGKK